MIIYEALSENFGINMIFFMGVRIKTLKTVFIVETLLAKVKVVTILAHPAILYDLYFAIETFMYFRMILLGLEYCLHLMLWSMSF
jgi:hypothetical protein